MDPPCPPGSKASNRPTRVASPCIAKIALGFIEASGVFSDGTGPDQQRATSQLQPSPSQGKKMMAATRSASTAGHLISTAVSQGP